MKILPIYLLGEGGQQFCEAQRGGKGLAANESETKPLNLDKNRTSKPPTGGQSL